MLLNYLRIAFRNIKKDRAFVLINVIGLAVGITCFIAISLYIKDELSFDKYNKNADRIYRVYTKLHIKDVNETNSKTSGALGPTLFQNFPEIQTYTRVGYFGLRAFWVNDKIIRDGSIYAVDSTFFDVFTLPFLYGNPKTALNNPNSLVLTESTVKIYFGKCNPVGRTLTTSDGKDFYVTGVIKDFPKNSHFHCDFLESMSTYKNVNLNWLDSWFTTYIVLKEGTDPAVIEKKLDRITYNYVGPAVETVLGVPIKQFLSGNNSYAFHLQPITSIYLYSQRKYGIDLNTEWADVRSGDISYTYIFAAVAIFIMLLAIINFMNLATARSEKRAKEVGIRKTLGSNKLKLVFQFISEAILMSLFSVIISIGFLELVLPLFNNLTGKELKLELLNNFFTIPSLISLVIIIGIMAGSYPAFYLSSFKPIQILKANSGKKSRKSYIRSGLVIIQFAISITLLIGTIIIKNQLDYLQNKNLGFNKDHLISIFDTNVLAGRTEAFMQELSKNPGIISLTNSSRMFEAGIPGTGYLFNKKYGSDPVSCQFLDVDYDFLKTYQIKMQSGRYFSKDFSTDTSSVILNEAAIKMFAANLKSSIDKEPLGKELTSLDARNYGTTYKIIGILKDFNYESLHREIRPLVLHLKGKNRVPNLITVRIASSNMENTIGSIKATWKRFTNDGSMYYTFVDQKLQSLYEQEKKTGLIATIFSCLAIFIACLGLFGLAAFVTQQRTKEIGIRKVLGSSVLEIITLLCKEFSTWVLLANIISWPTAYYIMRNWLDNFAYRAAISPWIFIISGMSALIIALITVGVHAVKAATANPVESLKYE